MEKEVILKRIEAVLSQFTCLVLTHGQHTDLEVQRTIVNEDKKIEYCAYLLFQTEEKRVVFWENIRESGRNVGFLREFKISKLKNHEETSGDYWETSKIREAIKDIIRQHGWKIQTALFKRKAMYQKAVK